MIAATISGQLGLADKNNSTDKETKLSQKRNNNPIHYTAHKQMVLSNTGGFPHVGDMREVSSVMLIGLLCLIVALILRTLPKIKSHFKV